MDSKNIFTAVSVFDVFLSFPIILLKIIQVGGEGGPKQVFQKTNYCTFSFFIPPWWKENLLELTVRANWLIIIIVISKLGLFVTFSRKCTVHGAHSFSTAFTIIIVNCLLRLNLEKAIVHRKFASLLELIIFFFQQQSAVNKISLHLEDFFFSSAKSTLQLTMHWI